MKENIAISTSANFPTPVPSIEPDATVLIQLPTVLSTPIVAPHRKNANNLEMADITTLETADIIITTLETAGTIALIPRTIQTRTSPPSKTTIPATSAATVTVVKIEGID
jgi:hypothetical protein